MSETAKRLLLEVRSLPAEEQQELAEAVFDGLVTPEEDAVLYAELERRRMEHESGVDQGEPAEEVFGKLQRDRV